MLPVFILAIEDDSDREFVAALYTRYQPLLFRRAKSILKDDNRAEEAVHDTMLRVIRYLDRIKGVPSDELAAYLATIIQTVCFDIIKKAQLQNDTVAYHDELGYELSDNGDFAERLLIRQEQADLLRRCMGVLSPRELDILNYTYALELTGNEVAGLMGLTPANVRLIISRAKKKVLAAYAEKGGLNYE